MRPRFHVCIIKKFGFKEQGCRSSTVAFSVCWCDYCRSASCVCRAAFPDDGLVTVKVNKKKTIREVLCGVMAERGLEIDSYVVHLV